MGQYANENEIQKFKEIADYADAKIIVLKDPYDYSKGKVIKGYQAIVESVLAEEQKVPSTYVIYVKSFQTIYKIAQETQVFEIIVRPKIHFEGGEE